MVQPLTPEEKAYLDSVSLEATSARSPLKHFKGRLVGIGHKEVASTFTGNNRNRLELRLRFDELEVYEASPPYRWKTAELPFFAGSQTWGILGASLARQLGPQVKLSDAIGQVITIKLTPGHKVNRLDNKSNIWGDVDIEAFEVISADGQGGVSTPSQSAISLDETLTLLADGATADAFETRIYQDSRVKSNTSLLGQLSQTGVMPILMALEQKGLIAKDASGVYHKAPTPTAEAEEA